MTDSCLSRLVESDARHSASIHNHDQGQLTYIERGVLSLEADGGIWAIPPGRLHWIPAGLRHASRSHGEVRFWLTMVPDDVAGRLPERIIVLEATPLLISALERLRSLQPGDGLAAPLIEVIVHEINAGAKDAPGMRLPTTLRMRDWALAFLAMPNIKTGIDAAADAVAMSRRSFTRHFVGEVGISFSAWKRAVLVHHAITRLAGGDNVGVVAFDLGYDSVSAFVAMFRAARGISPGAFQRAAMA